jgi:BirA family biotin operon repressor/biotin-[acetyl-CoA-carboxylase] ligase
MLQSAPFLDADELRATTCARHVEIHDELGSTNDRAAELARLLASDELPALIVARRQTAGRGRGRNAWWSAEGALTFSLLFEPAAFGIGSVNWPQLSLATAVALCDVIELRIGFGELSRAADCGLRNEDGTPHSRLGIKWPNDVMIGGGKVAGILVESPGGRPPAKDRLIIGIGVNVNNSWRLAPPEAGQQGVALCDVVGQPCGLQPLLARALCTLSDRIRQLQIRDPALIRAWQQRDLLAGQTVTLSADGRCISGECIEIADDGALVIDTQFGRQRFFSGSVRAR